jgi:Histidine kinase-, DNA gyrase B-, and HSP90-like ATPase
MAVEVSNTYDIVPTSLAVKAMRDNGYKNAAYAVAELMDNSIQARAKLVELLCADEELSIDQRTRKRISEVAVLDDGVGMDVPTLQRALQFGNGSWEEAERLEGMGRFGMGLPSASVSQCKKVEVWTWQDGPESAIYSYIDLAKVERGEQTEVPEPVTREIPEVWREASETGFGSSGTLVVWSKIDRFLWRTSKALIKHSESLIGRMYRKWIHSGDVRIRLASFLVDQPSQPLYEADALPNDPLYLMDRTSCPAPFDDEPMFQPFPSEENYEETWTIRIDGKEHEVKVRLSIAKEEARAGDSDDGRDAGNRPHGRHAGRNTGVSVVRAGRELELDQGWVNAYDPRERWWGVEVSFEPGLDDLFGVSNNKQFARNFAEAGKVDVRRLIKEHGGSIVQARKALEEDGDPIAPLLEVIGYVDRNIRKMRDHIVRQRQGKRTRRHKGKTVEERATEAVRRRQEQGHKGRSDVDEEGPEDKRQAEVAGQLEDSGLDKELANELAAETISRGLKYRIETSPLEAGAFFSVQSRGGVLIVKLNSDHPAHELLLGAQDPSSLPDDVAELKRRLQAAQEGLEMMLFAWARYEDEQLLPEDQRRAQDIRFDWGRMAELFLQVKDDGE